MRYLLQRPLPDELLGSVWIRTARRAGLPIRTVARVLTNGRKWAPGFFTAGHLVDLATVLGMQPIDLLWEHTVFPYATAFHAPEVFESAMAAAVSTGTAAIGMGAVTQSASDQVRFRRYCTRCAREERAAWGESYWHRAHNLPGVLMCLKHGNALRVTEVQTGNRTWESALPHELGGRRTSETRPDAFEVELARRSVELLLRPQRQPLVREPQWYRDELIERGLLSPDRQLNASRLAAWLLERTGGRMRRFGFNAKDAELKWPALMVRPRTGIPFVPLKHLVFQTALALQPLSEKPVLDHAPVGPSGRPREQLDKQFSTAVRAVIRAYVRKGERVRVCDALAEAGCWQLYRHSSQDFPRVTEAVRHLRLSAASYRPKYRPR
ncbi:TniQ family protein [Paucibacter sp. JuS9]|uniref:TniQ family protein n=1 Tax=Paucibacter sp. JuS9 TaxID=3228748 RepID=UPI003757A439